MRNCRHQAEEFDKKQAEDYFYPRLFVLVNSILELEKWVTAGRGMLTGSKGLTIQWPVISAAPPPRTGRDR